MLAEPIAVTLLVADALEALHVPYAIGGSLAGALHGVVRATMDADLVADLSLEQVEPLARALGDAFYADVASMHSEDPERHAYVISAEDIVLAKLDWYRMGNEVSDRQWLDVLGVLKVQGNRLDRDYMRRMADELGVADLLQRALGER